MSNEISVQIQLSCTNGDLHIPSLGVPQNIDQANKGGGLPGYVVVGTSEVDIDLSALTKPGYLFIKNLGNNGTGTGSPTVTFGPNSGGNMVAFGELKSGEESCLRLVGTSPTLTLLSDDADTGVQLCILED